MKKIFVSLLFVGLIFGEEWADFPSGITLNSGDNITIRVNGIKGTRSSDLHNNGIFTYQTNGSSSSTLTIEPNIPLSTFYNTGTINILKNSNLILNLSIPFIFNKGSSFNVVKNASLVANGTELTSYGGTMINQGQSTLNFQTININASGTRAILNDGGVLKANVDYFFNGRTDIGVGSYGIFENTNSGNATITIKSGYFSNFGYVYKIFSGIASDPNLSAISILKSSSKGSLSIDGGDVLNGGDVAQTFGSGSTYYDSGAGYIIADNGEIKIQKNLISEGAGSHLSNTNTSNIVRSKIQAINMGVINIGLNFQNKNYSDIYLNNAGLINVSGNFTSHSNTNLYFSGNASEYGQINAKNIDITGANIFLYKGMAQTNKPYVFLKATNSLVYDPTLLGEREAISEDGTISLFYKLLVQDQGKELQVMFKEIPHSDDVSDVISKTVDLNENEKNIIDGFDEKKPIDGFDIKNLGAEQIKGLAQNIESGIQMFVHNRNNLSRLRFEASSSEIFNRMIKSHSHLSSYKSLTRYAFNSIDTKTTYRSDTNAPLALSFSKENDFSNSLYASVLGGYQKSTSGYGYGYGLNVGYDRFVNENLFLGTYVGYSKNDLNLGVLKIQSDNFQMGIYAQTNFSLFQTDVILSYDYSNAKSSKNISVLSQTYYNNSKYTTHSFNALVQTGLKFNFGSNMIKPYIGITTNINQNTPANETGDVLGSKYLFDTEVWVKGILGIEYVKYFNNGGYFFIRPSIQYTFYDSPKMTEVIFLGDTLYIPVAPKEHFGNILAGGQIPINENFFINLNLSVSESTNKTFISLGSASLKFLF
ncbi:hypothetical protein BKH42_07270 [Helicobacter sp. 13S00482-2]|uniref:autotransporter family protein n=1 Tax=Helicobacter sp. 13S00482-2 TaxID=1476200 RepID=UPI000BA7477E|nr:autotransporter outer membrane beta-barrel domain-containing protein [Helicobacter sp. 13S00482-2]PAF53190.1 hypothetical protein BKH42_07270 [Helicobacter sp. 13S00482-2]